MKNILLLILFTLPFCLIAQKNEANGYVIDVNDAKFVGTISSSNPAMNSTMITFKKADTGEKIVYRPSEIKAWQMGEAFYESKNYMLNATKGYTVFMRRLCDGKGKVKLYEYWNTDGEQAFSQTFIERDGKLTELLYGRFRKFVSEYFKDCEELKKKIDNKEYKKKDILDIIAEYNAWREYQWN